LKKKRESSTSQRSNICEKAGEKVEESGLPRSLQGKKRELHLMEESGGGGRSHNDKKERVTKRGSVEEGERKSELSNTLLDLT